VRKDGFWGSRQGKDGFQDGGMGEVDAGFAGDIQGTEAASRGVRKELNKQGLGGSGQNALEKMKEIEKQILNKGLRTRHCKS
jgi:hypothetical protein